MLQFLFPQGFLSSSFYYPWYENAGRGREWSELARQSFCGRMQKTVDSPKDSKVKIGKCTLNPNIWDSKIELKRFLLMLHSQKSKLSQDLDQNKKLRKPKAVFVFPFLL